ncbi:2-phospho-L-lactate transferase [Microbacterium sp. zg.Y1090]|uniref:2-phospho-L-lactate transferase n=1 Tax=Microbacterium TaxID=33882 RepID=UPI00214A9C54|nr:MULTISPECIES: 2-phospho-L-lactate transferase [unclassified Microbacterium]MCR2813259.1 2-phospho-L-lactate transferase [Microbacterium sp. zg.Y1084]MCR2819572.1 2-phospho-L-lactate transferase [Microbacterium sp. zg.Y1090]WIM28539.1 2-phospho-L-lactate transferase [Microbacterium sp. zg-Y1090]
MASSPRVVVLAGGVGGSKFTLGVRDALARRNGPEATVVVNTGDDLWLSGVRLQPDVDSILYALAGVNDTERGWGRDGDTERVNAELQQWGAGWPWFTLGDLDLGTHLARTGWLRDGLTPTQIVERLSGRWPLGVRMLPMTDTEVDTHVRVVGGDVLHFQEWWTRHRAQLTPLGFDHPGIEAALPAPGVVEAIADADVVLLAPSNPVVSIGPILAVPGIREALALTSAHVVGVSPIIGGAVVRGMADVCLTAIGVETSAAAVAAHYGARSEGGLLDAWLIAEEDAHLAAAIDALGMRAVVAPLWMRDVAASAAMADAALAAVAV